MQAAQLLQVGQAAILTVKYHQFWLEATLCSLLQRVLEEIVLAQTILGFVIKSKITRQ